MRIIFFIILLFVLGGCDTLGDIIREKKYTLRIHETPNSKQTFGYNNDYDYVGFMVHGVFGDEDKHMHNDDCDHSLENTFK